MDDNSGTTRVVVFPKQEIKTKKDLHLLLSVIGVMDYISKSEMRLAIIVVY
jgi:hypothetical protein